MNKIKEAAYQPQFNDYWKNPVTLGPFTSYSWRNDPKHLCFRFSRYKFCSKLLAGKKKVLEVGCGDAFATPVVAQVVESVRCIDFEPLLYKDNKKRLKKFSNITFAVHDITKKPLNERFDAAFSLDVLEHIKPEDEHKFFENICKSLRQHGILIVGTPNITAEQYATKHNETGHINLKGWKDLQKLLSQYFYNEFLFSMNDEVVHTGYYPMAHYLFATGIGPKT
jgi:cyclopropane fatty-acyl-phospholipid synthase-like methyltransferase